MIGERRRVILTVDDLIKIFRDYRGVDTVPADAYPVDFGFDPKTRLPGITLASPSLKTDSSVVLEFEVKRFI